MTHAVPRPFRSIALLVALFALACAPRAARAEGVPDIASQLPRSFDAAILVPSLSALSTHASQLVTAMELSTLSSIEQLVTVMGLRGGLDFDRGAAAILAFPDAADDRIRVSVVVPVEDYGAFASNFIKDFDAQRPGISEFTYFGRQYFIKSVGDRFALIGETAEAVRAYEPAGNTEAFEALVGSAGATAMRGADLSLVLNVPNSKDSITRLSLRYGQLLTAMAPSPAKATGFLGARIEELTRDGQGITLAFTPGQLGLRMSAAVSNRAGTPAADLCADASDARLIEALPGGESYLAAGVDLAHPAMANWLKGALPEGFTEGVSKASILAFVPDVPFLGNGGAQRAVIRLETESPEKPLAALESMLLTKDDPRYKGQYGRRYKVYDEVPIDGWSFMPENPRAVSPMIIGMRPDILGAAAAHNGSSYIFTTRSKSVARAAMGLDGSPRFLETNGVVAQVRAMLPKNPSFELYVMPKLVLDDFASLIMFYKPTFKVLPQVPPAGMNVVIGGGSATGNAFVPAPTLAHAIELYNIFLAPTAK